MSLALSDQQQQQQSPLSAPSAVEIVEQYAQELSRWFGAGLTVWNGESGEVIRRDPDIPECDTVLLAELVRAAAGHAEPRFLAERSAISVLAIPLGDQDSACLAVAPFVTAEVSRGEGLDEAAELLALPRVKALEWVRRQQVWPQHALLRTARLALEHLAARSRLRRLESEIDKVSDNLAATYEEISLLYGVTQNLRISSSDEELGRLALDWLIECVPAAGLAILFLPVAEEGGATYRARTAPVFLSAGELSIDKQRFTQLLQQLELNAGCGPFVANSKAIGEQNWSCPEIRQLIVTPLAEGDNLFGWLAAFNHVDGSEFGTVEANLLNSVGAILGIHAGNHELYRQQSEFLASVVRALTSAIDAKDPYTCGHSDRVARISVRLAQELGVDEQTIGTLYMAGLLHDIGKIGIDDNVLRKPGRLTEAEYEHIKLHPELGHRILADIRQLADVLPVVLHHHEQWDGRGYPHGLAAEQIPLLARIAAVADAYDAMSSDRPYRKGMPHDKVEDVFHKGAGKQWDARVVEAFFAALDDIRDISSRERANLSLDIQQWT